MAKKVEVEEKFPVHESLKVLEGITVSKSADWWSAVLLIEGYRIHIATYLWHREGDRWKRKGKFMIRSQEQWKKTRDGIDKLIKKLKVK